MKNRILKRIIHRKTIEIFLFSALALSSLFLMVKVFNPMLQGDSHEYILMQEGFVNHFSPSLRNEDIRDARLHCCGSDTINCHPALLSLDYFSKENAKPMTEVYGYFAAYNGEKYCYHFWLYSLATVPVRLMLDFLGIDPFKSFQIFNVLLVLFSLAFILFFSKQNTVTRYLLSLCFVISAAFFYVRWPHPEVFSYSFFFVGLVLLLDKRFLFSALCIAIASTQNPPIAFFIPLVFLSIIVTEKFSVKRILPIAFVASLCVIPSFFYLYHFHVPNLIIYSGFTNSQLMTFDRVWSYFFDLNQGMVIAIPLILLSAPFVWIYSLIKFERKKLVLYMLPVITILAALPISQQTNWNSGCAVIQRYALWGSVPLVVFVIAVFERQTKFRFIFYLMLIVTQLFVLYKGEWFHPNCADYVQLNSLSKFVLNHVPAIYSPDPEIFAERIAGYEYDYKKQGCVFYTNSEGKVSKIWLIRSYKDSLNIPSLNKAQIDSLTAKLKFNHFDQAYITIK